MAVSCVSSALLMVAVRGFTQSPAGTGQSAQCMVSAGAARLLETTRRTPCSLSLTTGVEVSMEGSGEVSNSCTTALGSMLLVVATGGTNSLLREVSVLMVGGAHAGMSFSTSLSLMSTARSGRRVVVASWTSSTWVTVMTWVEHSVEQVTGTILMEAGDAPGVSSKVSWALVVEEKTSWTTAGLWRCR
ncbi:hypothetical protein VPH35_044886 [Triticum aestivum]